MAGRYNTQNIHVTGRDIEILHSLLEGRYLTVEAIEWLHFPQWQTRWARHVSDARSARYEPCSQAYATIRRLERAGLVKRLVRPTMLAIASFARAPDLMYVSERGIQLLAAHLEIEPLAVPYLERGIRSFRLLEHHAAVGRVYAALRCRISAKPELRLLDWRGEHRIARAFDTLQISVPQPDGSLALQQRGIQPDGAFAVDHGDGSAHFFVEVERDRPLSSWKQKVCAYEAYHDSPQLRQRYGSRSFTLLGIGRDAGHQRALLEATGEMLCLLYRDPGQRSAAFARYLIGHLGGCHPTLIGDGWQRLTAARLLPGYGVATWRAEVASRPHTLIS